MKKLYILLLSFNFITVFAQENLSTPVASAPQYINGTHYTQLDPVFETDVEDQVIVYEFFGYKCPHCSSFQPFIKPWHKKLPKHIKLIRVPVVFQPGWDVLAKAYYTAETMGIIEKTHKAMFDAIHKQRKRFRTIEDVAQWYAKNFNIDEKAFLATSESFMIDSMMRQGDKMMRQMKITSTPSLVINGKYKPNNKKLNSNNQILEVSRFLADLEAKRMGLSK